jgi:hypothetical protein
MFTWIIENIIGLLPVWFWIVIAGVGGAGYFLSGLIFVFIPFLTAYKEPFKILCIIICLGGTFMCGGDGVTSLLRAQLKEQQAKIDLAEKQSSDANTQIQTKIVHDTQVIHDTKIIVQEKIVSDSAKIDAECKIAPEAISDLNMAAKNPIGASK